MPNAGLLPAAVLAQRIDLAGLVDQRLRPVKHGASSGTKALTVIGSMLAGGDSIDDVAVLRSGATGSLFDVTRAPSTIGTWLRAHKWSNVRQLDAISRELLARLWAAGAGPADLGAPLTIDIAQPVEDQPGQLTGRGDLADVAAPPLGDPVAQLAERMGLADALDGFDGGPADQP